MSKALKLLEAVFWAEVEGRLPYQRKGKAIEALAAKGLVEPMEIVLPGRFPVRICGWSLTHLGRMTYCASCKAD